MLARSQHSLQKLAADAWPSATLKGHLGAATNGWNLHDLRQSRLIHADEDGAAEADLMNLSGHEGRRTLQRYL